jgi:hypothetical protein
MLFLAYRCFNFPLFLRNIENETYLRAVFGFWRTFRKLRVEGLYISVPWDLKWNQKVVTKGTFSIIWHRTSWQDNCHSNFVFGKSWLDISALRRGTPGGNFCCNREILIGRNWRHTTVFFSGYFKLFTKSPIWLWSSETLECYRYSFGTPVRFYPFRVVIR